jgi:phosphoenolpyruvate carboxykinase (ATP)
MYHFLSGYTAKVAGTERGVTEPTATFSTCFGAPFMVWPAMTYASLLGERIAAQQTTAWLVNTGWTGGPSGVGHRMPIAHTRALIAAALSGNLNHVDYETDTVFNVEVPTSCPGVPVEILRPRLTWENTADYDAQARKLASMFVRNFEAFAETAPADVVAAGPR